jgi:sigma-B regulation protein RsbU (phosphoserine phosphatase)
MNHQTDQVLTMGRLQCLLPPREVPRLAGWQFDIHSSAGKFSPEGCYDFIALPDGRLAFLLAGDSRHSGAAALLVAMMRLLLLNCPLASISGPLLFPDGLLAYLNRVLADAPLNGLFLTAQAALLSPLDGRFLYANAGHPLPLWWRSSWGKIAPLAEPPGRPLGVDPFSEYGCAEVILGPGDLLFAYTEGLAKARDSRGEWFGRSRLEECVRGWGALGAAAVKVRVLAWLEAFLDGDLPGVDGMFVLLEWLHRQNDRTRRQGFPRASERDGQGKSEGFGTG